MDRAYGQKITCRWVVEVLSPWGARQGGEMRNRPSWPQEWFQGFNALVREGSRMSAGNSLQFFWTSRQGSWAPTPEYVWDKVGCPRQGPRRWTKNQRMHIPPWQGQEGRTTWLDRQIEERYFFNEKWRCWRSRYHLLAVKHGDTPEFPWDSSSSFIETR